jgi:hypothetical protein
MNWTLGAVAGAISATWFAWDHRVGAALMFALYTLFCTVRAIPYWTRRQP